MRPFSSAVCLATADNVGGGLSFACLAKPVASGRFISQGRLFHRLDRQLLLGCAIAAFRTTMTWEPGASRIGVCGGIAPQPSIDCDLSRRGAGVDRAALSTVRFVRLSRFRLCRAARWSVWCRRSPKPGEQISRDDRLALLTIQKAPDCKSRSGDL